MADTSQLPPLPTPHDATTANAWGEAINAYLTGLATLLQQVPDSAGVLQLVLQSSVQVRDWQAARPANAATVIWTGGTANVPPPNAVNGDLRVYSA